MTAAACHWQRMDLATKKHMKETKSVFFNLKELQHYHGELAQQLQDETTLVFQVPKTKQEAMRVIATTPSMQFAFLALTVTLCVRLALAPFGFEDVVTMIGTKMFWEIQEWVIHAGLFHGSDQDKAIRPFQIHDRHHALPYFHVIMEPLPMVAGWYSLAAAIALTAVSMGAPAALVTTWLASYTASGMGHLTIHFLTHTKLPLKGWLQDARTHHIQHHLDPTTNFNIAAGSFDRFMKTD
ncbi:expressed unknown protein [Seminavis robusta]|uniref:Fatty acid hydroxylase domain-containing protein n=1 Tax=Seminavis robusta TaxID=568900 RepID=A0A9N8DE92_9STRA|nr:expressed unknown protein [Seminavis robusta]|eukprot:Sro99_g050780.1 n/a (239) ;mRNA; r:25401-26117